MHPKLHIETHGEGETTIVICNGLSQSTANWRGIARQHPQFRWVLFDARGHGRSSMGPRPYSLDDHVQDLLAVLEQTETQNPVLMGFSHGGRVALRAASRFPSRFKALVLISTGARQTAIRKAHVQSWHNCLKIGGVEAMAWASLPNIVGVKVLEKFPDLGILVKGSAARNSAEGLDAMFEGMATYPPGHEDAPNISCPTLVFHGAQDPLVKSSDLEDMLNWIPQAKSAVFPDCGHTLPLEQPADFVKRLEEFVHQSLAVGNA